MNINNPHWILHKSVLRSDTYECSACHGECKSPFTTCPYCGAKPRKVKFSPDYIDELEMLDIFGGK